MSAALIIIAVTILGVLCLGLFARYGKDMDLEQWTVGGRGFGSILVFVLMAGEIYTTFTFIGGSGFAYGHGAPVFYILCYGCLAYVLSYWMLPPIWRYAKQYRLIAQPDFFSHKYNSPALGVLVALVGIVALIPYLVLQLKGLGIIVDAAAYGAISSTTAIWIGAAVITAYVMVSGVHGSAWTAVVKDTMILGVLLFLGIYLPFHYYGGYGGMFTAINAAKPGFLVLPPTGESPAWFVSTVLLTALGFYMWPHTFGSLFTAKEEKAFRRNAATLPVYQLVMLLAFFVGFAAILQVPGLKGSEIDLSLLRLSVKTFDPWFVGVIGAAGVLTALVPGSMILMAAATLLANNIYRTFRPQATDATIARLARLMVPVVAVASVYFTLQGGATVVALLLMGYSFVTQLFPPLVASLLPNNPVTKEGAFAGICVGVATVAATSLTHTSIATLFPTLPEAVRDLNIGTVALVLNLATLSVVSAVTRRRAAFA
ncbi:MAG TPA: sodium:solute symporter [Rhodopila sp.]|jgi:SSS family solute:Na+ symporter|nr:sodium:solute symporter [Rhodopila sp.]